MTARARNFPRSLLRLAARLAGDRAGNVMIIVAASLFPLIALVGSGIDMGRGYLAQTRLQQACDAGTLAARKRLGTAPAVGGTIPASVADTGQRFFNINFRRGAYSSRNRQFTMQVQADFTIRGVARAEVPTAVMGVFGFSVMPISASCSSQINMNNTDIMMVLDTTGSMLQTNPGDTVPRIQALRNTVRSFHAQMEAGKTPGTRIRYGFLPYSTNVNVGALLRPEWLVDEWQYQSREARPNGQTTTIPTYETRWVQNSGTYTDLASQTLGSCPVSTMQSTLISRTTDAAGWTNERYNLNGISYGCTEADAGTFTVTGRDYRDYVYTYSYRQNGTQTVPGGEWQYKPVRVNLSFLDRTNRITLPIGGNPASPSNVDAYYRGCIEERDTYEISDYGNVDLRRAMDLDIDLVPDPNDPRTQWRPMLNELSFVREVRSNGRGPFTPGQVNSTADFVNAWWWGFGACPSPARALSEMTATQVSSYVNALVAQGNTYHDIGMIWGGRLLSPTGIFAAANADVGSTPTTRHLIYFTDGETAPLDLSYGSYGIEPLDRRRWRPLSSRTLTQTVEARFSFACEQVKSRNIQVWVVSFGTAPNPVMQNCAGADRYYVAANARDLENTFSDIARRMAQLRLTH